MLPLLPLALYPWLGVPPPWPIPLLLAQRVSAQLEAAPRRSAQLVAAPRRSAPLAPAPLAQVLVLLQLLLALPVSHQLVLLLLLLSAPP